MHGSKGRLPGVDTVEVADERRGESVRVACGVHASFGGGKTGTCFPLGFRRSRARYSVQV